MDAMADKIGAILRDPESVAQLHDVASVELSNALYEMAVILLPAVDRLRVAEPDKHRVHVHPVAAEPLQIALRAERRQRA